MKCFLKVETSVKAGDPRNISPRSDEFLAVIGPYISAIEHCLRFHPRLVKGLNNKDREAKLAFLTKFLEFLEGDYARYDVNMSLPTLEEVEYQFLCTPYASDEHILYRFAMRLAMRTFGVSEIGLCYEVDGTRASGDSHTSIGNGTVNDFNTFVALEPLPEEAWDSVAEGDDGAGGVSKKFIDQAIYNFHILPCLGFQIKLEHYKCIDQVSFCGRFLTERLGTIISTCDIRRTLAKMHTICSDGDPEALTLAKMISYYHSDSGTPIIGVFATVIIHLLIGGVSKRRLVRAVGHLSTKLWDRQRYANIDFYATDYPFVEVGSEVRAMVALRTDYTPGMQQAFEAYYMSFLRIGFIPSQIDRIPDGWNFDNTSQVYGPVGTYVC